MENRFIKNYYLEALHNMHHNKEIFCAQKIILCSDMDRVKKYSEVLKNFRIYLEFCEAVFAGFKSFNAKNGLYKDSRFSAYFVNVFNAELSEMKLNLELLEQRFKNNQLWEE